MSEVAKVFEEMNGNMTAEKAEKINSTYLFDIAGEGKWFADLTKSDGPWIAEAADDAEAKCTLTIAKGEDWVAIASGKMNATAAFMQGKLKVKGDMSLAMKLQGLLS
ncbi:MAG: SCP2 sterol-binding domain-containing protein [Deltaproteobacteria bacterium]|nr:SCP2 sterol-binding domain-containing protein [Deltaproteobacteria bacterium]